MDCRMIELIQNKSMDDMVLAPSFLMREALDIQEFKDLQSLALFNLSQDRTYLAEITASSSKNEAKTAWHITDDNIASEFERGDHDRVSFYFILRWLRHDISFYNSG